MKGYGNVRMFAIFLMMFFNGGGGGWVPARAALRTLAAISVPSRVVS